MLNRAKPHSLTDFLKETTLLTQQAFVTLDCENAGGSTRLGQAFPDLDDEALETLSTGPLIIAYNTDEDARRGYEAILDRAIDGYEETGSMVTSTVTFIGRANEGECSRTGVLHLVTEVDAGTRPETVFRFSDTGHLVMPEIKSRIVA